VDKICRLFPLLLDSQPKLNQGFSELSQVDKISRLFPLLLNRQTKINQGFSELSQVDKISLFPLFLDSKINNN
jgi:hypothetical protein